MEFVADESPVQGSEKRGFSPEDFAMLHPGGNLGKKLLLKVSDIMHTGDEIPIINQKAKMKDVILMMTSKRFGTTTVVNDKKELVGIFTDGDLRRLIEKTEDIFKLKAKDVMSKNPKTIGKDELAAKALNQMEHHKITCLIVVDKKKKPIGIVHMHDLLSAGVV